MSNNAPTKLSVERLEEEGYMVEVTEHRPEHTRITRDLFGFIDILAVHPERREFLGVQTTSDDHVSHRRRKILDDPELRHRAWRWIHAGGRIEIHGWRPDGTVRIQKLTAEDTQGETAKERIARMTAPPRRRPVPGNL